MTRSLVSAALLGLILAAAAPAGAQDDHLRCYKVKDTLAKGSHTADLGGIDPGNCTISAPSKMICVAASKTNVQPPTTGTGGTGTPNGFFCYKAKCPKTAASQHGGSDQFGARNVTVSSTKFLCAPIATPTPPPSCAVVNTSCGACGDGACVAHQGGSPALGCVSQGNCTQTTCSDDGACTPGTSCVNLGGLVNFCCAPCP